MISRAAALLVVLGLTWKLCLACNDDGLPVTGEHIDKVSYSVQHEHLKANRRSSSTSQPTHLRRPLSPPLGCAMPRAPSSSLSTVPGYLLHLSPSLVRSNDVCRAIQLPYSWYTIWSADGNGTRQLPVVLWHGMGDSCCNTHSIGAVRKRIQELLGGKSVCLLRTMATCKMPIWLCMRAPSADKTPATLSRAPSPLQGSLCTALQLAKEVQQTQRVVSLGM